MRCCCKNADSYASTGTGILGYNMFSYCYNNPIFLADNEEEKAGRSNVVMVNDGGCYISPKSTKEQIWGFVNGQSVVEYAEEKFGLGSISNSGCALIATYNVMQALGTPESLYDIMQDYQNIYGTLLFGAWGVGPCNIEKYLIGNNITFTPYWRASSLDRNVESRSVVIFTVQNSKNIFKGFHTMAAIYNDGSYYIFNRYNKSSAVEKKDSLTEIIAGRWICGYCIKIG